MPRKVVIGFNPGGNPELLKNQAADLATELQKQFNTSIEVVITDDYGSLVDLMKNKKVDYAFLSALSFVMAEQTASAKVLLKKVWNHSFYFSALVVRVDSKIKKISDLKAKKIAFVDKKSASGYLYPKVLLKKNRLKDEDFKEVLFSGNHSQSVQMLDDKKVDAIAVFSDDEKGHAGAWVKFGRNKTSSYRTLWVSEPIPTDPFTVRKEFYDQYPKFTHSLMFALIDLFSKSKSTSRFTEVLGNEDLVLATSRQYDPVREMVKSLDAELK